MAELEYTTVRITKIQKAELDALKVIDREDYSSVIERLIEKFVETLDGEVYDDEDGNEIPLSELYEQRMKQLKEDLTD